jgi:sulfur carrier protein
MKVVVNGAAHEVPAGFTAADAVQLITENARGIAVAVNGEVVTRSAWGSVTLSEGDRVEVLTAVQGG